MLAAPGYQGLWWIFSMNLSEKKASGAYAPLCLLPWYQTFCVPESVLTPILLSVSVRHRLELVKLCWRYSNDVCHCIIIPFSGPAFFLSFWNVVTRRQKLCLTFLFFVLPSFLSICRLSCPAVVYVVIINLWCLILFFVCGLLAVITLTDSCLTNVKIKAPYSRTGHFWIPQ